MWRRPDPPVPPAADDPLDRYRDVRVLVTGASGFIGRWVWRLLADARADVWVAGRNVAALERVADEQAIAGQFLEADLAIPGTCASLHARVRPSITFHLAGYGISRGEHDPAMAHRINAELPEEMALAALGVAIDDGWGAVRLVNVGSVFEYGSVQGPVTEDRLAAPATLLGRSKLEGTRRLERRAATEGFPAVTARVCAAYGPGERPHRLLPSLLRAARTGESLPLTAGEQERDFVFVRDVAEALLRLGRLGPAPQGVVNLGTGMTCSVRAFVEAAIEVLGLDPGQIRFGALPYREDEVWQGRVEVSRLQLLLEWLPPTSVPAGIRRTRALAPTLNAGFS
jgi:nucleoside-diphosphate-sugar epimerase